MQPIPLRTTVIGSYPFPAWLEFASANLDQFGNDDIAEMVDDAVVAAVHDQLEAGTDVITDGEQTRLDFNLSFYGFLQGIQPEPASPRRWGPPAHDQRGKHTIIGELSAPDGLGAVEEFQRLQRLAPDAAGAPTLKASVPGPYTLSGRLLPNEQYTDRYAVTEALLPIVRRELEALVAAGCRELTVVNFLIHDYREDLTFRRHSTHWRACRSADAVSTHLCFCNSGHQSVSGARAMFGLPGWPWTKSCRMAKPGYAELNDWSDRRKEGCCGRNHRREELLYRTFPARSSHSPPLPRVRSRRPPGLRA